jgi:hypothetical protein
MSSVKGPGLVTGCPSEPRFVSALASAYRLFLVLVCVKATSPDPCDSSRMNAKSASLYTWYLVAVHRLLGPLIPALSLRFRGNARYLIEEALHVLLRRLACPDDSNHPDPCSSLGVRVFLRNSRMSCSDRMQH